MKGPARCLHCQGRCRLTSGAEIYPHRPDLVRKAVWKCDGCDATVGCHPGTTEPLGFAADRATRDARVKLHHERIDPLWKAAPSDVRKQARDQVYHILSEGMGLARQNTHTGMFTLEQCREAWRCLIGVTLQDVLERIRRET
jgi:hypothetical protein